MQIQRYELFPESVLLDRLKRTRLKGYSRPNVYRDATLEIWEDADPEQLVPAQQYVLTSGVELIIELAKAFATHGIDIFALKGGLLFWLVGDDPEKGSPTPLIPPVIEESHEPDGRTVLLISDGIHRIYAARKLARRVNVVLVRNVPTIYPYYAFPLAQGWKQVEELDYLPTDYQKKEYRVPDNYKALFRDFNEIFEGVQKQRNPTNPAHLKPGLSPPSV